MRSGRVGLVVVAGILSACTDLDSLTPERYSWGDLDGDGWTRAAGDCDDDNPAIHPQADEWCDEIDDDCDGSVDEDVPTIFYLDRDGDSYGDPTTTYKGCRGTGHVAIARDCDDSDDEIHPDAEEVCDKLDNDCNGEIDDGFLVWAFHDLDGDGFGGEGDWKRTCDPPFLWSTIGGDCDDSRADFNPGALEVCDEQDNNCDGNIDETFPKPWHHDFDEDGYGSSLTEDATCVESAGVASDTDCDDLNAHVNPGLDEWCDGADNDCDGVTDNPGSVGETVWYPDYDGDGYGTDEDAISTCDIPPAVYIERSGDCDGSTAAISPRAREVCDDIDNDCDGVVDDGWTTVWYEDSDGDAYGNAASSKSTCAPGTGWVAVATDCDDTVHTVHPGAREACDQIDNDCDDLVDDGILGVSSGCRAESCAAILISDPTSVSGDYFLDAGTYACDMTTSGGGWTRVQHDAAVDAATAGETAYNSEGFSWTEAMFSWSSGTMSAGCDYPDDIASCNPFGFRFGSDEWAVPAHSGAALCGYSVGDYSAETIALNTTDFIISRAESTDAISLAAMEAVATCGIENNTGAVTMCVWVR